MSSNGPSDRAEQAAQVSVRAEEPAADALAEVPPGRQGRRAAAPVHRADGGHRAGVRLLGHALESLRQMDAARRRAARGDLRHRVLLPDAPAGRAGRTGHVARSAACPWPSGRRGRRRRLPAGVTARVELAPFRVAQAGIKTAEVGYAPLTQTLTTVGYVAFDERRMANIVSKVPGKSRVEKLVRQLHRPGRRGRPDPGRALQPRAVPGDPGVAERGRRAAQSRPSRRPTLGRSLVADRQEMVRASAEKLKRWGITQAQIDEILKKGKTDFTFPILSPISGHVFKKNVVEGQEVQEGYAMFEVVDLHTVWVQAQVYEHQLGLVHEGQAVEATRRGVSGRDLPGQGRVHPAAPRPGDPHRRSPVRPG